MIQGIKPPGSGALYVNEYYRWLPQDRTGMSGWVHCFSWPLSFIFSSGKAFDCGRYISSLSCTSTSRWGDVSPIIFFNKYEALYDTNYFGTARMTAKNMFFCFPGPQTFMSVWTKVSVSSPVQSPLPQWAVWVLHKLLYMLCTDVFSSCLVSTCLCETAFHSECILVPLCLE